MGGGDATCLGREAGKWERRRLHIDANYWGCSGEVVEGKEREDGWGSVTALCDQNVLHAAVYSA